MATSTLSNRPPEEQDNPGQEEYQQLTKRFQNPDDKDNKPLGNPTDPRGDAPSGDASDPRSEPSKDDLSEAEKNPDQATPEHENPVGRGYRPGQANAKGKSWWGRLSGRQKAGIGAGGAIGGGIIAIMLFLLPALRLEGYLATIDQRVFAAGANAVSKRVETMFGTYLATGLKACGNRISIDCKASYANSYTAAGLFKSWQDARIEQKLFDKYHFEVVSIENPTAGEATRYKLKDPFGHLVTLSDGDLRRGNFTAGSREFGNEINQFLKDNTRWYQVMERRSIRKYLVRKHDVKFWCFFACKTKDAIDLKALDAKTKLKYKLVERIIYPFSPKLGVIMDCIINPDSSKCTPEGLRSQGIDRDTISDEDLDNLISSAKENPKLSQVLVKRLLERFIDKETAQKSVGFIPIVGYAYLALSIADSFDKMDQCIANYCLSHYAADLNSAQYLEYYTAMRSADDEIKSGVLPADQVGALVDQFNDGGQPAEQSLVYQSYVQPSKSSVALLGGTAYAASTSGSSNYVCQDGQPIPAGQLVCPEKRVARTFTIEQIRNNNTVSGIVDILNLYGQCIGGTIKGNCVGIRPRTIIRPILHFTDAVSSAIIGPVVSSFMDGLKATPKLGDFITTLENKATDLVQSILKNIFPLPVQPDSPGREKWDGLEAGAEVAASEFNKGGFTDSGDAYGLGGQTLSDKDEADAAQAFLDQANYDNSHSSLINRIAGTDNPSSLVSRFAMAMPSSLSQLSSTTAGIFLKPFHSLNLGFIFHPAYAAGASTVNAFGIPRSGYAANDPVLNADPSIYTPQYCDQLKQRWLASKTDDKVTGFEQYSTSDPCLLEQVAVEAASSVFTNNDSLDQ